MGVYRVEETKPSVGYLLDSPQIVSLASSNSTQQVVTQNVVSKEQVIKGKLEVAKMGSDGSSGITQGLADVEFTIKLYSDVQKNGWEKAKTYDVLVTDQTGRDTSVDLPYGIYQVKETKTPENYYASGDFFITIDQDQEMEYRMVNNAPFKAWLKIVKTDDQGQKVTLSHATFKLKDEDGNYVKQKVGLVYKDEWTTDEKGYVVLDDMVKSGIYTIEELKTPEGFLIGDDIKVEISSDRQDIIFDEDHQPVIEVTFVNEKPTGHLILHKTFELDKDTAVGGAQFKVTANSDIVDPTTGKLIYKKGEPVNMDTATDGIYMIDESGKLELKDLPLGTDGAQYKVEEIKTVDGYVLLDEPVIFVFEMKDNTTKEYVVEKTVNNKLTETYFSKQDLNGTELKGGEYTVIDAETGEIVEQWTSDGQTHLIKGLVMGKDYIYREDLTPLGYTYAKDVKFTMSKNKQTIVMNDTQVDVTKLGANEKPVKGATLQVVSTKTKDIVDQWVSDESKHLVEGLKVGETYILREIKTPDGYVTANEIPFIVKEDEDMHLSMIDTRVSVQKKDDNGNIVKDAILQITDQQNNIIDEWTTDGTYHVVKGLKAGETYTLTEIKTPEGYKKASSIVFTVDQTQDMILTMTDDRILTDIQVNKIDSQTHQNIVHNDFEFTIYSDEKCQNPLKTIKANINKGIVTFTDLAYGQTVYLKETKAPQGYQLSNEVVKIVIDDQLEGIGNIHSLQYENTRIPVIVKTGDSSNIMNMVILAGGSLGLMIMLKYRSKKEDNM